MMRVSVLSLFPDLIRQVMSSSVIGRAWKNGLFTLELIQIRDFAVNDYGKVDDYCYGGGTGMLMMAQPVLDAWLEAVRRSGQDKPASNPQAVRDWREKNRSCCRTVYLSPRGQLFSQQLAGRLVSSEHLILICGHYEGIDQRVIDLLVDQELSIGDYVLTGGELAACVVMDAIFRLVPGVLPASEAYMRESHMSGVLEHPHYTRPASWLGHNVPDVLLSGHQANIDDWQSCQSRIETIKRRPDMLRQQKLTAEDWEAILAAWPEQAQENAENPQSDSMQSDSD